MISPSQNNNINQEGPYTKFTSGLKKIVVGISLILPMFILRITSLAVGIFGKYSENLSLKLKKISNKFDAIQAHHDFKKTPDSILCKSINMASLDVIWNERDITKTEELFKKVSNPELWIKKGFAELYHPDLKKLANSKSVGGLLDGVCISASISIIKLLLNSEINNEDDLVRLFKTYENGFSEKIAAQQEFYDKILEFAKNWGDKDKIKLDYRNIEAVKKDKILAALKGNQENANNIQENFIEILKQKTTKSLLKSELFNLQKRSIERLAALNNLCLEFNSNITLNKIKEDVKTQQKFNQLENGYYNIILQNHSIVFIKKEFGAYIFDPNYGLIKCDSKDPSFNFIQLLKFYPYEKKNYLNEPKKQPIYVFNYSNKVN